MKRACGIVALAVLFLILALPFARSASASEAPVSLTVVFEYSGSYIPEAEFELYKVGDFGNGAFVLTGEFADNFSTDGIEDHEGWDALAAEMKDFVDGNGIEALASGFTDENGRVSFSGLSRGLYLVIGRDVQYEDDQYCSVPFLVALPSWDSELGEWINDVTAMPKPGMVVPVPTDTPAPTETPEPVETPEPTETPAPTEPGEPTPTPEPLPQTGMQWTPVFWLVCIGAALLTVGTTLSLIAKK